MGEERWVRRPVVAGMFYEGDARSLRRQLERCFTGKGGPGEIPKAVETPAEKTTGLVSPHAGYEYSGACAAHGYAAAAGRGRFDCVVMVGPNHSGMGAAVAVYPGDGFATPLGVVPADKDLGRTIAAACPEAELDEWAHSREHSLEVQLPFLQFIWGDQVPAVAAVAMSDQRACTATSLGKAIAESVNGLNALLVASTDLSHFHRQQQAETLDKACLEPVLQMDGPALVRLVEGRGISMCGYGPVAAVLTAAKALGLGQAQLLHYTNSGEVTGDRQRVVGYASVLVR